MKITYDIYKQLLQQKNTKSLDKSIIDDINFKYIIKTIKSIYIKEKIDEIKILNNYPKNNEWRVFFRIIVKNTNSTHYESPYTCPYSKCVKVIGIFQQTTESSNVISYEDYSIPPLTYSL